MTSPNNLNENIDILQYITFLIGTKLKEEPSLNYYIKCKEMAKDFMCSGLFDISVEEFNIGEYLKED